MVEIPTQKNLAYYIIATLLSVCGGLGSAMMQQGREWEKERKIERENFEKEKAEIYAQARADAREASEKLTNYLLMQDSINRANLTEIQKLRRR